MVWRTPTYSNDDILSTHINQLPTYQVPTKVQKALFGRQETIFDNFSKFRAPGSGFGSSFPIRMRIRIHNTCLEVRLWYGTSEIHLYSSMEVAESPKSSSGWNPLGATVWGGFW
jgi:hypothetical protein